MAHVEPGDAREEWEERRRLRPTDTHDGEGRPYQVRPPELLDRTPHHVEVVFGDMGVEINDTTYLVRRPQAGVVELMKPDRTVYQVRRAWCSCPDFAYRRHLLKWNKCKHILACEDRGLFGEQPAPLRK